MNLNSSPDRQNAKEETLRLLKKTDWPSRNEESWRRVPIQNFPLEEIFIAKINNGEKWQGLKPDFNAMFASWEALKKSAKLKTMDSLFSDDIPHSTDSPAITIFIWHDRMEIFGKMPRGLDIYFHNESFASEANSLKDELFDFIGKAINFNKDRFTIFNTAFSPGRLFIKARENIVIKENIEIIHVVSPQQNISLPRTLLMADRGAVLSVAEFFFSADVFDYLSTQKTQPETQQQNDMPFNGLISSTEIFTLDSSRINYYGIEKLSANTLGFINLGGVLKKDSVLDIGMAQLGGRLTKWCASAFLQSSGCYSHMHGFAMGTGNSHLDLEARQLHQASNTTSKLNCKRAVTGRANSTFSGLLVMEKEASGSTANQLNKNLVLGSRAKAHTVPKLEIKVDDVKCSHGATIGDIAPETIFYLTNRGIKESDAKALILEGFFQDVIRETPITGIQSILSFLMKNKLNKLGV